MKRLFLLLTASVFTLLLVEAGLRVIMAFRVGPSVLTHGLSLKRDRQVAQGLADGVGAAYTKYFPNQERYDSDPLTGERFRVTINRQGFRGVDFPTAKEPGVVRVVTLGGSSTFGWRSRDNETSPFYLEQELNRRCRNGRRFEVLNLGIPHLDSPQILPLFVHEGLPLEPDIVTFYEGLNDAEGSSIKSDKIDKVRRRLKLLTPVRSAYRFMRDHLLLFNLADSAATTSVTQLGAEELASFMDGKAEGFIENLSAMHRLANDNGATFIVASQQVKSYSVPPNEIQGVTYADEVEQLQHKLEREGELGYRELVMLTHAELMAELERWVEKDEVPYVDLIEALDTRRDTLVSRVHLTPEGNRLVALALATEILRHVCVQS